MDGKGALASARASQFQSDSDRISQNAKRRAKEQHSGSRSGRERKAPLTIRRQISFQADIQLREFNDGTGHRDSLVWWASAVVWSRHRGLRIEKGVTEPAFIVRALGPSRRPPQGRGLHTSACVSQNFVVVVREETLRRRASSSGRASCCHDLLEDSELALKLTF